MRILEMYGLARALYIILMSAMVLVSNMGMKLPMLVDNVAPQKCGPDSPNARFAIKKWLANGGVPGIVTPGLDSLRLLTDRKSAPICAALNVDRRNNDLPVRTIFRLGKYYVAVHSPPLEEDRGGNLRINESDGIVLLFDQTHTTLAIGHTRASDIYRPPAKRKVHEIAKDS